MINMFKKKMKLHEFSYDGLGPGEIPSIPRIIPKILLITFQYCRQEQTTTGSGNVQVFPLR